MNAQSTYYGMGTVMTHHASGSNAEDCLREIRNESIRLEKSFSRFIPESDISRLNRSAGICSESINQDTFDILSWCMDFSKKNEGFFDITISPLVDLWRTGMDTAKAPGDQKIRQTIPLINYRDLTLNLGKQSARLKFIGQSIDLGGIGKGFAGDRFLEIFQDYGIESAYSNLGGNVITIGSKPDGSAWHIGIQHPREEDLLLGTVSVIGKSVVTSGDYQRYFTDNQGIRQHHILDPLTGYPVKSGVTSVTVVSYSALLADALSTTLFVAGMEEGLEILERFPGTEAIFVDEAMQVFITPGLEGFFQADFGIETIILRELVR